MSLRMMLLLTSSIGRIKRRRTESCVGLLGYRHIYIYIYIQVATTTTRHILDTAVEFGAFVQAIDAHELKETLLAHMFF